MTTIRPVRTRFTRFVWPCQNSRQILSQILKKIMNLFPDKLCFKRNLCFLGLGGLLMAYALLESKNKTNETNVCVFERENRLGGKIFDFNFTQAPDVAVGKSVKQFLINLHLL